MPHWLIENQQTRALCAPVNRRRRVFFKCGVRKLIPADETRQLRVETVKIPMPKFNTSANVVRFTNILYGGTWESGKRHAPTEKTKLEATQFLAGFGIAPDLSIVYFETRTEIGSIDGINKKQVSYDSATNQPLGFWTISARPGAIAVASTEQEAKNHGGRSLTDPEALAYFLIKHELVELFKAIS
jgi:hypothetical protein